MRHLAVFLVHAGENTHPWCLDCSFPAPSLRTYYQAFYCCLESYKMNDIQISLTYKKKVHCHGVELNRHFMCLSLYAYTIQ